LGRVDDQGAFLQRDAGQPARHHLHVLAGQHERTQVDVARRDAAFDEGGAGRQAERGLGDIARGIGLDRLAEVGDLLLGGSGADQHAVAAGAVDLLDDKVLDVRQDVLQVLRVAASPTAHREAETAKAHRG